MCDRSLDPCTGLLKPNQFHQWCRYATRYEREERWLPTLPNQIPLCFLADARLRRTMLVCLLVCLFLMQSDHSTEFCRVTVGNMNDK